MGSGLGKKKNGPVNVGPAKNLDTKLEKGLSVAE